MSKREIKIVSEIRAFDSYFKVDKALVLDTKEDRTVTTYPRYKLTRPDAVAVLILNKTTDKITLVKQYRYPVAHREVENIIEIVAGKIDGNESPQEAVCREVLEEVGYKISKENLTTPTSFYASPGYSTEKIHVFIAFVTDEMKVSDGGGVTTENESIEVVEMDVQDFMKNMSDGSIVDSKTLIAGHKFLLMSLTELLNRGATISVK